MITVNSHELTPTVFPDGTSQIWNLPHDIITAQDLVVDWRFESERELIDLFSLRFLNLTAHLHLYMPFLPYGRQDKIVANHNAFNLRVFGDMLKNLNALHVETLDAHNPALSAAYGIENIQVTHFHKRLIDDIEAECLVFPDSGAANRYKHDFPNQLIFEKTRDSATGEITGHHISCTIGDTEGPKRFLIIDDICDGGATFISVARALNIRNPKCKINLFVTHGIFSKGREHLEQHGINLFTTDSLPRNKNLKGVFPV